jgi:hypothetical protein
MSFWSAMMPPSPTQSLATSASHGHQCPMHTMHTMHTMQVPSTPSHCHQYPMHAVRPMLTMQVTAPGEHQNRPEYKPMHLLPSEDPLEVEVKLGEGRMLAVGTACVCGRAGAHALEGP